MFVLKIFVLMLPWPLKRMILNSVFNFEIHSSAYIGFAWVFPAKLVMGPKTKIGHFTVAIHLDFIQMSEGSTIERGNWITGMSKLKDSVHFKHQPDRDPSLIMREYSAITKNHHIDCTNRIEMGRFSTLAGYQSQLLTHSIDLVECRQNSAPIKIGDYTFIGTNVVILGGSSLPNYSVLGAKSLLNKSFSEEWKLYGGVPAVAINDIPTSAKYFTRREGFVK